MAERLDPRLRPTGMWMRVLGTLVVAVVLAGCGDVGDKPSGEPRAHESVVCTGHPSPAGTSLDLDGDGTADDVRIDAAPVDGQCRDAVIASVGGHETVAPLAGELPVSSKDLAAVRVPGRTGDLLLVTAQHPRGGFQATLYGYADGALVALTVDGQPIFPFVATDAPSTPMAATCTDGGFEVTVGRRHEPIGVAPAWDVDRTTYVVDGTTVTKGATTEVADNVLEKDFRTTYRALLSYSLFANCRVTG